MSYKELFSHENNPINLAVEKVISNYEPKTPTCAECNIAKKENKIPDPYEINLEKIKRFDESRVIGNFHDICFYCYECMINLVTDKEEEQ